LDFLQEVFSTLQLSIRNGLEGKGSVRGLTEPQALLEIFTPIMAHIEAGLPRAEWLGLVESVLSHSTSSIHDGFFNQLYGGFQAPGIAGDWLATVLNMSMATLEISPVATVLEGLLFARARTLLGYGPAMDLALGGGTLVPGGSNGNMVALLIARNALFPETKATGLGARPRGMAQPGITNDLGGPLCFFVSSDAHYSFEKAANATGIGTANMITVAIDNHGRMDPKSLSKAVKSARAQGRTPFFVGATSGTTVRGAFDPIDAIADVCANENLWLHVDAALGGSLLFSSEFRHLLAGIERSDSVVWDAHKLMNVPLVASLLLCKDPENLVNSNSGGGEDYLFHASGEDRWDTGVASLQCGRRADVFKILFAWLMRGERNWAQLVEGHLNRAHHFGRRIAADPRLELVHPVESLTLCFRVRSPGETPSGPVAQDQLRLRDALVKQGRFMVNYAQDHGGQPFLRLVALNNLATDELFENFFSQLLGIAGHQGGLQSL
jgi:glutamate/tyrosine decarboxylase-like PLP-dependent enzyme